MALDADRLATLRPLDRPILHLYDWDLPSATYGYFIAPKKFFSEEGMRLTGLALARRPTGGGIVFHTTDLAFSVLMPSGYPAYPADPLASYAFVNERVLRAVRRLIAHEPILLPPDTPAEKLPSFCFAMPTVYDVMLGGRKVAGAAQRRKGQGFLHQGSVAIVPPDPTLIRTVLLDADNILAAMQKTTYAMLSSDLLLERKREELKGFLIEEMTRA